MYVCLFDIDGTLISSGGAGKMALEMALADVFKIPHRIEKLSLSGRTDRAIIRDVFRLYDLPDQPENWQRLTTSYLGHLPLCLERMNGSVLPGIVELLARLHTRADVLIGLLTGNVRAGARTKLGHFGLYDFFPFGGFGDEHFDRDDVAREAVAEARRRLDGAFVAERVWVIGDTPLDIQCARTIGARAVAVATGWHTTEELAAHAPDLLMTDLANAGPLLDRLT